MLGALTYIQNAMSARIQVHAQAVAQVFMFLPIHVLSVQAYMQNVRLAPIQVHAPVVILGIL